MKDWNEGHVNGHSAKDAADREHARHLNGGNGAAHQAESCPIWPDKTFSGNVRGNSQANFTAFLQWAGIAMRQSDFTGRQWLRRGKDGPWFELNDEWLRALRLECDRLGCASQKKFWEDVLRDIASRVRFHEVREWLATLQHDGTPRIETWLAKYLGVKDTPLTRKMGRIILIAAVRRVMQPGCKFDIMVVLEGEQGAGKSSVVKILAGKWGSDSLPIGSDPKIVMEQTERIWLVEIPELTGLRSREVENVKAMISREVDRARLAWGTCAVDRPRQFTMWGTVNNCEYLQDTTGNRRFWPLRVGQIDLDGLRRDRDQLWAEAVIAEHLGESVELPPKMWALAAAEQAQRLVVDPWEAILAPLLDGKDGYVMTTDINIKLGLDARHQNSGGARRIANILNKLGFERRRVSADGGRPYAYTRGEGGKDATRIVL